MLVNILRGWVIALAMAIQEEDWDEVARVKDAINAELCNLLKSRQNFKV